MCSRGKLEVAKQLIVGEQSSPGAEAKLIEHRHASANRQRIAELSSKLRGTGTNEHRIIDIDCRTFGVKYESEYWHGLFSRVSACSPIEP